MLYLFSHFYQSPDEGEDSLSLLLVPSLGLEVSASDHITILGRLERRIASTRKQLPPYKMHEDVCPE